MTRLKNAAVKRGGPSSEPATRASFAEPSTQRSAAIEDAGIDAPTARARAATNATRRWRGGRPVPAAPLRPPGGEVDRTASVPNDGGPVRVDRLLGLEHLEVGLVHDSLLTGCQGAAVQQPLDLLHLVIEVGEHSRHQGVEAGRGVFARRGIR